MLPWFDRLTMRDNPLITLDLILSCRRMEAGRARCVAACAALNVTAPNYPGHVGESGRALTLALKSL